jgi:hypothetical protein
MIQYPEYNYGEIVILDIEFANSSKVKVIKQSEPNRIYTTVQDLETLTEWDTMTNRLSRIYKLNLKNMKSYKLLKKYETPSSVIYPGVIKTANEWKNTFDDLDDSDFETHKDWFEEVIEKTHNKRHSMCEDQIAQIDCRVEKCNHNAGRGFCLNISPAITFNADGSFRCWSYEDNDEKL